MANPKWFKKGKSLAHSLIPIRRFFNDRVFSLKTGGYGCLLKLDGIDDEGLTDQTVSDAIEKIEGAFRGLPEDARVYQYARVRKGYDIPRSAQYGSEVVERIASDRIQFLDRTANFRRIELFWIITVEPENKKSFGSKSLKPEQYARQTGRLISRVERAAEHFAAQLGLTLGVAVASKTETVSFFAYLVNLEPWSLGIMPRSPERIDEQIVRSNIDWDEHKEHLTIGRQFVQMFSLIGEPGGSRPNLFAPLLTIDANMLLCSMWIPKSRADVRKQIGQVEGFAGLFRHKFLAVAANMKNAANLEKSAAGKAADKGTDKLASVIDAMDNQGERYGLYSFIGLVHSADRHELAEIMPQVHKVMVDIQAPMVEETLGNLSAYYALLPGNSVGDAAKNFNVRTFWLQGDHNARMALAFAPSIGSVKSEDLDNEYLCVYETRTKTPYFLDPFIAGLRMTLIVGAPGSGKSVTANNLILNDQKYGGYTFIVDQGGSYESTVRMLGGSVTRVGANEPLSNPFSLEPTDDSLMFLFQFFRMLMVKSGAVLDPADEDVLNRQISRMYLLPEGTRRLKNLRLGPRLDQYLTKWREGGVYGKVFDNVKGSLELSRVHVFEFEGVGEGQQDLVEPMLFWILRQINQIIYDPQNLGIPKHILMDELFKHLKTKALLDSAINSLKTGRKYLAGVTLATQAVQDLGENTGIILNACTTQMFLPDPNFDRKLYKELFNLNDQEMQNLASLSPREIALKRVGFMKILKQNLDPKTYWLFSTKPKDRVLRAKQIEEYGYERALELQGQLV